MEERLHPPITTGVIRRLTGNTEIKQDVTEDRGQVVPAADRWTDDIRGKLLRCL